MDGGAFLILMVVVVVAILFLGIATLPEDVARKRHHPSIDAIRVCQWVGLVVWPAWFVALVWAYNTPDVAGEPAEESAEIAGRFRISGVDRATKMDTTWRVEAASEANARAKAELEGIIVTKIERVG